MKEPEPDRSTPRQVLGISLEPSIAAEVKNEAINRGISLKKLFLEMWDLYKKKNKKK